MKRPIVTLTLIAAALGSASALADPTKMQCVSANETAQSLASSGKLREARERLLVCVSNGCPGPVRDDCTERLTAIDKAMPTIVFDVKDATGGDLSAVELDVDGVSMAPRLDGSPIAVDPGEHVFRLTSSGLAPTERKLVVHEGEKDRHVRIVLAATSRTAATIDASSDSPGSTQRTVGLVAGGAGVVGLIVGSVFGLIANSKYHDALSNDCTNQNPNACTSAGVTEGNTDARNKATIATVAFVAGGALLAGGAVLYFTAPKETGIAIGPTAFVGGGGLGVRGAW